MLLYLINPSNPLVSMAQIDKNYWNRYRIWKPLGLMILAGLTPPDWRISIIDENLSLPDYSSLESPDLVGITAFTSQAPRAYEIASHFQKRKVPVIMGGIHASMCTEEAAKYVNSIATGEAESIWGPIIMDVEKNRLKNHYDGGQACIKEIKRARHDLQKGKYIFGSIQTTRGCPLNCNFCSVTVFNGASYRQRPIPDVIHELKHIREKIILVVDDNLIGTSKKHVSRAKRLFRAMIRSKIKKKWVAQATINFADDEELLRLAKDSGCKAVFIGFESPVKKGLFEVNKKINIKKNGGFRVAVQKIQKHNISVIGSFIIGLDSDRPGIGRHISRTASKYGIDILNTLFLTPLPGTRLGNQMDREDRIALKNYPIDWKYYTLTFPVGKYTNLSMDNIIREMVLCNKEFYSIWKISSRILNSLWRSCNVLFNLVANLSYFINTRMYNKLYSNFKIDNSCRFD